MTTQDIKVLVKRPTHLGRKPKTAAALLRQTHKFLDEEGKWIKGYMFKDGDAKKAYEDGFCGKWGVCSVGALGVVSGEFTPSVRYRDLVYQDDWEWDDEYAVNDEIVIEACAYLVLVINPEAARSNLEDGCVPGRLHYRPWGWSSYAGEWLDLVINWNDDKSRKRKQVLEAFAKAAELAATPAKFETVAWKYLEKKGKR